MSVTRRDLFKVAAVTPFLAGAKKPAPLTPIVATPGTRLYPTWDASQWWTTEPVPMGTWTFPHIVSLGASLLPDGATMIHDLRNTPVAGVFSRAYFQVSTPPLDGPQTLEGVVSAAIHGVEWHRRIDAVFALQVVVHASDTSVRGVALPLFTDALELALGDPPRSRAAQDWPLTPVACSDGDVIAINLGMAANNQTGTLAQLVGFSLYASQVGDIGFLDDSALGNTWVEFSKVLQFKPV